ncbi:MAG: helix-turn-helix transcriptional regulator [Ruminococcaceae bacterium]|nr:helix-turn-helix transcriptional regulator [Oscillospiraceae bacterium]
MDVAQALRAAREKIGKTQTEIANILGMTQSQYARYELGKREMPLHYLIALADLYELTLDELVGRDFQKRQR